MNQQINLSIFVLTILIAVLDASAQSPNVVFIITDDQGYGDLSCHGNPVLKTPNLDQLYSESVRLTDYHVAPTCSPTRAALQTGRWSNRVGVWHTFTDRCMLYEDETTIGELFKNAGYSTGMFGKWHLGDNAPFRPKDRGYDEVLRHGGGGIGQTPDYWDNAYFDGSYFRNGRAEPQQGFCTDVFFSAAKEFIASEAKNKKPFFAYISTNAAHGPFHSPKSFSSPYSTHGKTVANFFGMIANIDHNVGKLRDYLKANDLEQNTIFVFTTDNGTAAGQKICSGNMRGRKGSEFDGGHRVPFFIYWPKGNLQGGHDVSRIAAHVDVLPTLLDLCNIKKSDPLKFDGRSLKPLLLKEPVEWPDRVLFTDSQRVDRPEKWRKSCVMTDRWRLVNQKQLFDMNQDPQQTTDVSSDHPDVVERLQHEYDAWWEQLQPSFRRRNHMHVGLDGGEVANLTSHDWTTGGGAPLTQAMIRRAANDKSMLGHWNINVLHSGMYRVSLRRWPREAQTAIDAELPPGAPVPGTKAFRDTPGIKIVPEKVTLKIGESQYHAEFVPGSAEVNFEVSLKKGKTTLAGRFVTKDGTEYGTYYAYVVKL